MGMAESRRACYTRYGRRGRIADRVIKQMAVLYIPKLNKID